MQVRWVMADDEFVQIHARMAGGIDNVLSLYGRLLIEAGFSLEAAVQRVFGPRDGGGLVGVDLETLEAAVEALTTTEPERLSAEVSQIASDEGITQGAALAVWTWRQAYGPKVVEHVQWHEQEQKIMRELATGLKWMIDRVKMVELSNRQAIADDTLGG